LQQGGPSPAEAMQQAAAGTQHFTTRLAQPCS
jgi:hypothetical protein